MRLEQEELKARAAGATSRPGPFGEALIAAADEREEIVGLTADLAKYTDMVAFRERHPDRFLDTGMAEQSLVSVAAGLEMAGFVPVATSFGVFLTRRALDFAAMQVSLHGANVKLVGGLPGLCSTFGPSHQAIDDLAHMRAIPGFTVIDPCDPVELGLATSAMIEHEGPVYMRQLFGKEPVVVDPGSHRFEIGRASLLHAGDDVGIAASSITVAHALAAADELERRGVSAAVLNVSTLKPFDEDAIAELAERCGGLVTAENHSLKGGLFSAVSETLCRRGIPCAVEPVGLDDSYGSFGSLAHNVARHGLGPERIEAAALTALGERQGRGR